MADRVLFIGWNRPVIGREKQALETFGKSIQYYEKLKADGKIEGFDTVILDHHGGDLNGFVMLKGTARQIAELRGDSIWIDLMTEAGIRCEGLGGIGGVINEGVTDFMTRYTKLLG